jgi:hypothetical protein
MESRPGQPARRIGATLGLLVVAALGAATPAGAAVPFKDIASTGPLEHVFVGNDLSCQVSHTGDARFELFPSGATPASCGSLVFVGGALYAPDFANHDGSATGSLGAYTALTAVSQSEVSGAGTAANPYKVTTVAAAGATGLQITEIDTYVAGQESYRTDVTLQNTSGAPLTGILYRAGDCFLQESDTGFGFTDDPNKAAGCSINANNAPAGRIEQWFPITAGAQYMEAGYSEIWAQIATHTPFPNTCRCAESIDNGAGISWTFTVAPGGSATYAHYTTFSPTGAAGPPPAPVGPASTPPTTTPRPPAFGPGGIVQAPSTRRCVSRRNFRIRVRNQPGATVVDAVIFVNGRRVRTLRGRRIGAYVDLRGLPKGTFTVRIVAILSDGRTIRGTRKYRTCVPGARRAPRV